MHWQLGCHILKEFTSAWKVARIKTKTGGQLMCAVGRDPNDEYFPFAYAVVEAETKDTWTWFLNLLLADIGDGKNWVFISD